MLEKCYLHVKLPSSEIKAFYNLATFNRTIYEFPSPEKGTLLHENLPLNSWIKVITGLIFKTQRLGGIVAYINPTLELQIAYSLSKTRTKKVLKKERRIARKAARRKPYKNKK